MGQGEYISFITKCEWNKLVEYEAHLPFMVKVKYASYYGTDLNGKTWFLLWDGGSIFFLVHPWKSMNFIIWKSNYTTNNMGPTLDRRFYRPLLHENCRSWNRPASFTPFEIGGRSAPNASPTADQNGFWFVFKNK